MDLNQLVEFTWGAIAGGVYYDTVKDILGNAFPRLDKFKQEENKQLFEASLSAILETNDQIRNSLSTIAQGGSLEVTNITTGNIESGGAVIVGNHNTIGGAK
ncbi:MAG: hypothetical protein HRU28_07365 [Rhizobiales bacterium]|nr:hypothetical protein [Hyphomicrobiales bacterium]